ncbi:MAG: hypothetical protein SF028_02595 [Candidatus Sumerlaeia bacterium]|nr:hypothetical protein [Candidatus Sumerlaeia bacterium]
MTASNLRAVLASAAVLAGGAFAATPPTDPGDHSWGASIGWLRWDAAGEQSASFNRWHGSGLVWSANAGWINLGDGSPANGHKYANEAGEDFGVNVDATSDRGHFLLSGLAWSANLGWISFDAPEGAAAEDLPRIEKNTGLLKGRAWSANVGWLTFETGKEEAFVQTGLLRPASEVFNAILGHETPHPGLDVDGNGVIDTNDVRELVVVIP